MVPGSPRPLPRKALATLTAAVLLAHLALLQSPIQLPVQSRLPAIPIFTTRSVEPAPAKPTAVARPVMPPAAVPARIKPAAAAKAAEPEPTGLSGASQDPASPPAPLAQQAPEPSPDAPSPAASQVVAAADPAPSEADQASAAPRPPIDRAAPPRAYTVPRSARLKYEVKGNKFPYSLDAEMLWRQDGESYDAKLVFSAGFLTVLVQTSRGQIGPEGLAPLRYSDKKRSEVAAHFVREKGKVTFSANTPDAPLLAGAQDRLSILMQLAAMIAGDQGQFPQATTIALQTIGPRDADTWLFTVGSEETLELPGGEQVALKLVRNPRQEFDQKVELWLAPALGYLPVRLRITESNGDFLDQKLLASEAPA